MLEKWKSLSCPPWYSFPLQPSKNQSVQAKVSSYEIHCRQMRFLKKVFFKKHFGKSIYRSVNNGGARTSSSFQAKGGYLLEHKYFYRLQTFPVMY